MAAACGSPGICSRGIPLDSTLEPVGDVSQLAANGCGVALLQGGRELALALFDRVKEQALIWPVLLGAPSRFRIHEVPSLGIEPGNAVHSLRRRARIALIVELKAESVDHQRRLRTVKDDAVVAPPVEHRMVVVKASVTVRHDPAGKLPGALQRVIRIGQIIHDKLAAGCRNGRGCGVIHGPKNNVDMMDGPVGKHASAVIKPPGARQAGAVERDQRGRTQPLVPVVARRWIGVGRPTGPSARVRIIEALDEADLAKPAGADQLDCTMIGRSGTLLCSHQSQHPGLPRRVHHRAPLRHRVRQRLFYKDRLACLHRVQKRNGMPVFGGGDNNGVDILTVQYSAVIHVFVRCLRARRVLEHG